jgi:AraC-like DNA-binding protein
MDALSTVLDDIQISKAEYIYLSTRDNWAFQQKQQSALIVYIVLSGEMYLELNQTPTQLKTGDIFLITTGQNHCCFPTPQQKLIEQIDLNSYFSHHSQQRISIGSGQITPNLIMAIRCQIDSLMAQPLLNALPNSIHLHNQTGPHTPQWLEIGLSFLALETQSIRLGRAKIIDHLIGILFIECIRDYMQQIQDTQNWLNVLSHPQLSNALSAIHSYPERAWTVESLAECCCMSRSKFASLFHQCVGQSPLAYLQQHRLNLASHLLRHSQSPIKQIAHDVGYQSDTAFSQSFKKQFKTSPSLYRKQHK